MSQETLSAVLRHLRRLCTAEADVDLHDNDLLQRFTTGREESAFTLLVQRHGPMVLGVCKRVLQDEHAAEDAFQATFLVLVKRSATVRRGSLASWLYGVAQRVALHARARAMAQRRRERLAPAMSASDTLDELTWQELRTLLDEEIAALPERYRAPIVLCHFEGKSYSHAAKELGCPKTSLASRLSRAREMLRERLGRRGITLSALALATGLTEQAGGTALPALLAVNTVNGAMRFAAGKAAAGALSSQAVALAQQSMKGILGLKGKMLAVLLLTGAVVVGAGLVMHEAARQQPTMAQEPDARQPVALAAGKPRQESDRQADADTRPTVTVVGRVLDPDGKPFAGARLFWPRLRTDQPRHAYREKPWGAEDVDTPQCGKSDAAGRFRVKLPAAELAVDEPFPLIAAGDGHGCAWEVLSGGATGPEVTMRLVRDQPIRGRIVNTEGKPVPGANVTIVSLLTTRQERIEPLLAVLQRPATRIASQLKKLEAPLQHVLGTAVSDADGRFQLTGAGTERVAVLLIRQPTIAHATLWVVNRQGVNAGLIASAARENTPRLKLALYGPTFEYVATPTRVITGTVRDATTHKALAGVSVWAQRSRGQAPDPGSTLVSALTDAEGHYRLVGLPKEKQYLLSVYRGSQGAWPRRLVRLADTEGFEPIRADIELARGVSVSGRVIDRQTGKGVHSRVRLVLLLEPLAEPDDSYPYRTLLTDNEGRFRLAAPAGRGVLLAEVLETAGRLGGLPVKPYKLATLDRSEGKGVYIAVGRRDERYFSRGNNQQFYLSGENAIEVVDLPKDKDDVQYNLLVDRGKTIAVKVRDATGKPVKGALVAGLTACPPVTFPLDDDTCTVYGLDEITPRQLVFLHPARKLGGTLTVRGDESEALEIQLEPTASFHGRLLDADGKPIAGAEVRAGARQLVQGPYQLAQELGTLPGNVKTDGDGNFLVDCLVPELSWGLSFSKGRTFLVVEPRVVSRELGAGAEIDLGDRRARSLKP